jgi:hypothetical protein
MIDFGIWKLDPTDDILLNTATGECKTLRSGAGNFLKKLIQRSPLPVMNSEYYWNVPGVWKWVWDLKRKMGSAEYERYIKNIRGGYQFARTGAAPPTMPPQPSLQYPPASTLQTTPVTTGTTEPPDLALVRSSNSGMHRWGPSFTWLRKALFFFDALPQMPGVDWSWLLLIFVFPVFLLSAMAGGALWALCGGHLRPEIHGLTAVLWPVISMLPCLAVVMAIHNYRYGETLWREHVLFLVGMCCGSWLFYNLPLTGGQGFRALLHGSSRLENEILAVLMWAALLAAGSLLKSLVRSPVVTTQLILIVILITSVPVIVFLVFHPEAEYDVARGVVAGVSLRIALSFGLLVGTKIGC